MKRKGGSRAPVSEESSDRNFEDKAKIDKISEGIRYGAARPSAASTGKTGEPFSGPPSMFTDLVCNIDGNRSFNGSTAMGHRFQTLATVVEASRSNLESRAMASGAALAVRSPSIPVKPKSGFQTAYELLAAHNLQPLRTVEKATARGMHKLIGKADCHFGLVAFSDRPVKARPTPLTSLLFRQPIRRQAEPIHLCL